MSNRNGDKLFAGFGVGFVILWIFSFLLSIGFLGVVVWAIIKLVNHFAG